MLKLYAKCDTLDESFCWNDVSEPAQDIMRWEERLALVQREGGTSHRAWRFIHTAKHTHTHGARLGQRNKGSRREGQHVRSKLHTDCFSY